MKTEHKYAQVLRWIADGEDVEGRCVGHIHWENINDFGAAKFSLAFQDRSLDIDYEFRLKPRTITVNGREIATGEAVAPKAEFFFVDIDAPNLWGATCWGGTNLDKLRLERGLVHLTKENAIAHAKAMLGID